MVGYIVRPRFFAKIWWIALTLLFKFSRADIRFNVNFTWKTIDYLIYITYFRSLLLIKYTFLLFSTIIMKVSKTQTSFLIFFKTLIAIMAFLFAIIALNISWDFFIFIFFDSNSINVTHKSILALILTKKSSPVKPIVLVFFGRLYQ